MRDFIDTHTHIFDDKTYHEYLDRADEPTAILTIHYWTGNRQPKHPLRDVMAFAKRCSVDMRVIAAVNPNFPIDPQLVELWSHMGTLAGLKLYLGYEHFYPYDEKFDMVAKMCADYDKPLVIHSGDCSARGNPLVEYAHPLHVDKLANRHPNLKIVIAHMGFPWFMDTAMVIHKNENVYADLSGIIDGHDRYRQVRSVARYIDDLNRVLDYFPEVSQKLMFGTDFSGKETPLSAVRPYYEVVEEVFKGAAVRDAVLRETAKKVFALEFPPRH